MSMSAKVRVPGASMDVLTRLVVTGVTVPMASLSITTGIAASVSLLSHAHSQPTEQSKP